MDVPPVKHKAGALEREDSEYAHTVGAISRRCQVRFEREGSEARTFLTIRRPMNAVGSSGSYTGIREHPLERLEKCEQIRP